jgi:hypothetical protein
LSGIASVLFPASDSVWMVDGQRRRQLITSKTLKGTAADFLSGYPCSAAMYQVAWMLPPIDSEDVAGVRSGTVLGACSIVLSGELEIERDELWRTMEGRRPRICTYLHPSCKDDAVVKESFELGYVVKAEVIILLRAANCTHWRCSYDGRMRNNTHLIRSPRGLRIINIAHWLRAEYV